MGSVFDPNSGGSVGNVDAALISSLEGDTQRTFHSPARGTGADFLTVTTDAYFLYMGRATKAIVARQIEAYLNVVAAAGLTSTVFGLFSSPSAPNKAGQDLTCLICASTETVMAGLGRKRFAAAQAVSVVPGTHLWVGYRAVSAGVMPTMAGVLYDLQQGLILTAVGCATFVKNTVYAGALVAAQAGAAQVTCAPDLSLTLD
jgi:hypothetical protein